MSDKTEILRNWIEKADHDLGTAQITCLHIPKFSDTIAFHCQQAVEKYLKAYLIFLDIPVPRTHDLNYLLSLVSDKENIANDIFDQVSELEEFAVEIRYPEIVIELTEEDIARAIQISKDFRKFVLMKMNLIIDYEDIA
jgi:HEPN domain-containing protein